MLHLDKKVRQLDKIKSLGCLSVQEKDWPALRDEIIGLQKQGMSLVAHVDSATGEVTIRQAGSTAATSGLCLCICRCDQGNPSADQTVAGKFGLGRVLTRESRWSLRRRERV